MEFTINGEPMHYDVSGGTVWGDDVIMLENDDNLILGQPWERAGYTIAPFLSESENDILEDGFQEIVRGMVEKTGAETDDAFTMAKYHRYVNDRQHYEVVKQIQSRIPASLFPVSPSRIEERLSEICGCRVAITRSAEGERVFWIRIVRPDMPDANPLHRDVWLDRLRNKINIYYPLAGSNRRSSLCIVPGSHLWKESEIERTDIGATVNGVSFTVPSVVSAKHEITALRPNPGRGEVLVFSPYLIHGYAINMNKDTTRVSLEIRLQRRSRP